jgi:hypothetical protein
MRSVPGALTQPGLLPGGTSGPRREPIGLDLVRVAAVAFSVAVFYPDTQDVAWLAGRLKDISVDVLATGRDGPERGLLQP